MSGIHCLANIDAVAENLSVDIYSFLFQSVDLSEAQEGDPKYLASELMAGKFGKPADVFRWVFNLGALLKFGCLGVKIFR